jgi:hypothetical protein
MNEIRSFTYINEYGCIITIYGETLSDAIENYVAELEFSREDDKTHNDR